MKDGWNPTSEEIREWAFDAEAVEPVEDFDLALAWLGDERLYFNLASDESCPKRRYFLAVLYLIVGDAVRSSFHSNPRPVIEGFIANGDNFRHPDIHQWQQRSRHLLAHPDTFDYGKWCAGGFAEL